MDLKLILCIVFCFYFAEAIKKDSVCEEYTTNCGLIPPAVPDSFIMKSLEVDTINKKFSWTEKYFDPANLRGKFQTVSNGIETTYLYDYSIDQITTFMRLHPGATLDKDAGSEMLCLTQDIKESNSKFFMGYKADQEFAKRSTMYNSYEALQFGGSYNYAHDNTTDGLVSRNVACNVFVGCVYDKYEDKTVSNQYFWSKDLFSSSGAETVPLRIVSNGGYYDDTTGKPWVDQKLINEVVFFDGTPQMNDLTFQVPPRMKCQSHDKSVKVPKLPQVFSTRMESIITIENLEGDVKKISQDWYEEMWYDYSRGIARQDSSPSLSADNTLPDMSLSIIFDFNTGIAYNIYKTFGRCLITNIPEFTYFAKKSADGKTLEMVAKDEVFDFSNENLSYKGKYETRDIKCDTWSGEQDVKFNDGVTNAYRELYFSTDGWHEENDKQEQYSIPIQETRVYQTQHEGKDAVAFMEINYYKFKTSQPSLSVFDISGCIEQHDRRFLVIEFDGEYRDLIENHRNAFVDSFRTSVVKFGNLGSVLRIQEVDVMFSEKDGNIHVYFTVLQKPKIEGDVQYPKQGSTLKNVVLNIKSSLKGKKFIVELQVDPKAEPSKLSPVEETFREVDFRTSTIIDIEDESYQTRNGKDEVYMKSDTQNSGKSQAKKENQSTRYSPGTVGILAGGMLIVGLGIGILVMFIYLRKMYGFGKSEANLEFANES